MARGRILPHILFSSQQPGGDSLPGEGNNPNILRPGGGKGGFFLLKHLSYHLFLGTNPSIVGCGNHVNVNENIQQQEIPKRAKIWQLECGIFSIT